MLPKQKAVEIIFPLEISIIIWDLREWCFFLPFNCKIKKDTYIKIKLC
ncbi:hypothetical protein [Spiroplasma endosymbiont of Zeiraphera isertana]